MDEPSNDGKRQLRERQTDLIRIIEAFDIVHKSKEWMTLRELIFDKSVASLERQLLNESLSEKLDTDKIYRLQGEWIWARQYIETDKLISTLKNELDNIKQKLQ